VASRDQQIIIFGPPGAGKGTQGVRLAVAFGLPHLSTGDLLRAEQDRPTERGRYIDKLMKEGSFASDQMMLAIIRDLFVEPANARGLILDGFPRTLIQAEAFDLMLDELGRTRPYAVEFALPDAIATERMLGRGRADDTPDILATRLGHYHELTEPMRDFYDTRGRLVTIDADSDRDSVGEHLLIACERGRRKALLSTLSRDSQRFTVS